MAQRIQFQQMNTGGRGRSGLFFKAPLKEIFQMTEQLLLRSEPRKREDMKRPREEAGDQKRRTLSWLITFLISALLVIAGLALLRSLIAIITLD
jgi:hypothetical protein